MPKPKTMRTRKKEQFPASGAWLVQPSVSDRSNRRECPKRGRAAKGLSGEFEAMKFFPLSSLSVVALLLSTPVCWAGVCSGQITQVQTQISDKLDALAEAGPTANQTVAAMMHRQPTPNSVAAAEARIGDLSPEALHALADAMGRARRDDISGDRADCEQALAIARHAIGR